ncbi:Agamous-like MADS-box protein AGL70 [Vitis vinifera]|uniref:Agamous-like MADS-box protein AGL70 n=1 Tax=Vitis vinifera TaxID=29760 RepID=A0A438ILZ5_VITVI|nr:Agamous-like MADS-box protein AGL70 [Vitis vinifera]
MGRRKIEIKKIESKDRLMVTFSKRRAGLFKKAQQLSQLSGATVAVLVFSPAGKPFTFSSGGNFDETIASFQGGQAPESTSQPLWEVKSQNPHPNLCGGKQI